MNLKNTPLMKTKGPEMIIGCPALLNDAVIAIDCSRINKEHIFRLIGILLNELNQEGHDKNDFYKVMSKSYFEIVVTDNFKKTMWSRLSYNYKSKNNEVSEKDSIFQTSGIWSKKKKHVKDNPMKYRINPQLLQGETVVINYFLRDVKREENLNYLFPKLIGHFHYSFAGLTINIDLFRKNLGEEIDVNVVSIGTNYSLIVRNTTEGINFSKVKSIPNFFVERASILGQKDVVNVNSTFLEKKLIEVRATYKEEFDYVENEIRIILDGPKVTVDVVEDYITKRDSRAWRSAINKANDIHNKIANPVINPLNGRFSTPITLFNRVGIKYLSIDGFNITSFDLKTSQIVILTNLMLQNKQFIKSMQGSKYPMLKKYLNCFLSVESNFQIKGFMDYLLNNDIYSDIAVDLKVIRSMAKIEMFRILFTEPGANLPKYSIREKYPYFFEYLKAVKVAFAAEFGESKQSLAYFLQMTEAHIFLECILHNFANEGIKAFGKHDSILIPSHAQTVKRASEIIDEQKRALGISGNFEREEYDVDDWTQNMEKYNDPFYNLLVSYPELYKLK